MSEIDRYPGLLPGNYPGGCKREGATVFVDSEGGAICSGCSSPSASLLRSLGYIRLPDPKLVSHTSTPAERGGTDDRPRSK